MKLQTLTISATFALMATTALSQTTRDDVVQMLSNEGYTRIEISRTFFGNMKFEAYGPLGERELVLGKDGAILRDHAEDSSDESDDTSSSSSTSDESNDSDDDENGTSSNDESDDTSSSHSSSDESDDSSSSSSSADEADDDSDDDENDTSDDED